MCPLLHKIMKVQITTKVLLHDRLGRLVKGQVADIPDNQAEQFLRQGWVQRYETKVISSVPSSVVGEMEQSSASPAAPASPQTTSNESDDGEQDAPAPAQQSTGSKRNRNRKR